jgi:hypothetical protein
MIVFEMRLSRNWKGIELILRDIRDREASLGVKNGTGDLQGNGMSYSKARCTNVENNWSQSSKRDSKKKNGDKEENKKLAWNVPQFPDDWKDVGGGKLLPPCWHGTVQLM